jgi:hypothetical protein
MAIPRGGQPPIMTSPTAAPAAAKVTPIAAFTFPLCPTCSGVVVGTEGVVVSGGARAAVLASVRVVDPKGAPGDGEPMRLGAPPIPVVEGNPPPMLDGLHIVILL